MPRTKRPAWVREAAKKADSINRESQAKLRKEEAEERQSENARAKKEAAEIITRIRGEIEEAASSGDDEARIMQVSNSCRNIKELTGAAKLVAQHCRTELGLQVKLVTIEHGTDMLGDGIPDETYLVVRLPSVRR